MKNQIQRAYELFTNKNYKEALKIYDDIFTNTPNQPLELKKYYAVCLQERLKYDESIKLTNQVLKENPNDLTMLLNYCICMGKQNKHVEAIEKYKKILSINKDFKEQIGYYAYLLERTGSTEKAEYYWKTAIDAEPENLWYISHYAFFLQKEKRYSDSEFFYRRALEKDPENTWLIKRYALLINEVYGKEAAYKYYNDLIERNPENYNYYINAAELYMIYKNEQKAAEFLEQADKLEKPLVMQLILLFYWGIYFIFKEDYRKANNIIVNIDLLRSDYPAYIHRDLTDINAFINNSFNSIQREKYEELLCSINKEVKNHGNN